MGERMKIRRRIQVTPVVRGEGIESVSVAVGELDGLHCFRLGDANGPKLRRIEAFEDYETGVIYVRARELTP